MTIQKGNLLDAAVAGDIPTIMHGCNCFHAMGSGIAGELAKRFPQVPKIDQNYSLKGYVGKLGTYSLAKVTYEVVSVKPKGTKIEQAQWRDKPEVSAETLEHPFNCINLYTQYNPGPDFIASIFPIAIAYVNENFAGQAIGIPLIGCGIGGGDWESVMGTLLTAGSDVDWKVYVL
jgi:hypothetical protein